MKVNIYGVIYFLCFVFAFWGFSLTSYAQTDIVFKRIDAPFSSANTITQDDYGFIWVGSENGLYRYDGKGFKAFLNKPEDSTSLLGNQITHIFNDGNGRLWVGTTEGLCLFDYFSEKFRRFVPSKENPKTLGSKRVFNISKDKSGNIWVAAGGANLLNEKDFTFTRYRQTSKTFIPDSPSPFFNGITIQDRTGRFWLATWADDHGIDTVRMDNGVYHHLPNALTAQNGEKKMLPRTVSKMYEDRDGNIWFATYYGLFVYDLKKGEFEHFKTEVTDAQSLASKNVLAVLEDRESEIWAGTYGGGLSKLDRKSKKFINFTYDSRNNQSIPSNDVLCLFEDRDGRIWVGTANGLAVIEPLNRQFKLIAPRIPSFDGYNTGGTAIVETEEGELMTGLDKGKKYLGSVHGGVVKINPQNGKIEHFFTNFGGQEGSYASTLRQNPDGSILVCIETNKAFEFRGGKPKELSFLNLPDKKYPPRHIIQASTGEYILADWGSYFVSKNGKMKKIPSPVTGGPSDYVDVIFFEDLDKSVWALHRPDKLWRYNRDKEEFEAFEIKGKDKRPFDIFVSSVAAFESGVLWISHEKGIEAINTKTGEVIRVLNKSTGLPSDHYTGITFDSSGILWASNPNLISRIDTKTGEVFNIFANRDLPTREIMTTGYGLGNMQKGRYSHHIYLQTTEGILSFNPDKVSYTPSKGKVFFTKIKKFNAEFIPDTTLFLKKVIELAPDDDMINIEFAYLNFTNSAYNSYQYQLINFDKKPVEAGTNNSATYTNLPPGKFVLRVWAADDVGNPADNFADLVIIKHPHFWQTNLFLFLCVFLAGLVLYSGIKIRFRAIKAQNEELERKVAERTEELCKEKDKLAKTAADLTISNEEINSLNEELNVTLEQIKEKTNLLEQKSSEITASINYASRIQKAMMPQADSISLFTPYHVIINMPRNIVSGDFYWTDEIYISEDCRKVFFAVVDCTGHGVPGAMMSMVGINILDEIVSSKRIFSPEQILAEMNNQVRKRLKQEETDNRDGMEVVLLCFDMERENGKVYCRGISFAGAMRPLCYIDKDDKVVILNGDKQPVGGNKHKKMLGDFTRYDLDISDCKRIFAFSDGYHDQFGGKENKKLSRKRFFELVEKSSLLSFDLQMQTLQNFIKDWIEKGEGEQTDDILLVGFDIENTLQNQTFAPKVSHEVF